jgi:hypothetical protein
MTARDPLLRGARRIAGLLDASGRATGAGFAGDLAVLLDSLAAVTRLRRIHALADGRAWTVAACHVRGNIRHEVRRAAEYAARLLACPEPSPESTSLRSLVEDLRQLGDEFENVEFDLKGGRVVATTKPIELEDVPLGPFAIELHLKRLGDRFDSSCFGCVALKPNPASGNDSVTHPHVQDGQLCAGDASVPISAALRQGRICDAFCLVRSVLQTYNAASPYVALDSWDGVTCSDCSCSTSRENTSGCEHCDQDYCDECMSCCEACDGSCCRGCLERDGESDAYLCPSCRTTCDDCGRVVNSDDVEGTSGLCPQCRERQEEEEQDEEAEEEHEEQDTQPEDRHGPDPIKSADAGQPATAVPATLAEQPPQGDRAAA